MPSIEFGSLGEPGPQRESQVPPVPSLDPTSCAWLLSRFTGLFGPISGAVERGVDSEGYQFRNEELSLAAKWEEKYQQFLTEFGYP